MPATDFTSPECQIGDHEACKHTSKKCACWCHRTTDDVASAPVEATEEP